MPEDRDQLFERALARHLRAEGAGESLCLDPETLAAYHERMLSPDELSSAKSHIVSCARCQEVLVQLEATQEANELQEMPEVAPSVAARAELMFPGQARQTVRGSHAEKPSKAVVALPQKRSFTLRWAAPAGAIAAALLIWLGVRDSRVLDKRASEPTTQVAENRQQLPASPPREESKEFSLPQDKELGMRQDVEKQKAAGSAGNLNEAMPRTHGAPPPFFDEKKDSAALGKLEREKRASPAYEYSRRNGVVANGRGPSAAAAQAQANNALQRGDQSVAGVAGQMVEVVPAPGDLDKAQAQTRTAKSDALVGAKSVPPPPPPASPSRDQNQPSASADDGSLKAKNAGVAGAEISSAGAFTAPALSRAVSKVSLDIRIAAPGGKTIWSVGPGGQILRSLDGGRMWLLQVSGVAANLTGGSAPSDKVCWIAGAAGTLLRTTDSGLHWQEIRTPISGDLGGVHASDAKHASIWDAANHVSYETSDGGKSWKQSANE